MRCSLGPVALAFLGLGACDGGGGGGPDAPPPAPRLVFEGAPFDLGLVEAGTTAERDVTVRNAGDAATGVVLSTGGASLEIVENDCVTLAPGAACTATVRLAVATTGAVAQELRAFPTGGGDAAVTPVTATGAFRLTVVVTGDGAVTSAPAGIDCGAACTALFAAPSVTLTATAAAAATFAGWSGGCTGTGTCTVALDASRTVYAQFDTATALTIRVEGLGAGFVRIPDRGVCSVGPCVLPVTAGTSLALTQHVIGDSTFVGWSGCAPDMFGACNVTVNGAATVTATYAPTAAATWVRTARVAANPADLALAADGFVVAGSAPGAVDSASIWIARYAPDGAVGPAFVDDATAGSDWAMRVAIAPGGDTIVTAALDGSAAGARFGLRRYTAAGAPVFAIEPGGALARHGLALDDAGNIYVSGLDGGTPYIASYTPAGGQRWRINPAGATRVQGLAVRGGVLAAVGAAANLGWVGTFDLAGGAGWQRTVAGPTQFPQLVLFDAAIDGDGDVVFGGLDTFSTTGLYVLGAMAADGSAQQWVAGRPTRTTAELWLRADDTLRIWIGYATTGGMDPSRLVDFSEAGVETRSIDVVNVRGPGGHAIDAAGVTFLAGEDWTADHPSIERRP